MKIALRMDDVNASTKQFLRYSKKFRRLSPVFNIGPLKSIKLFKAWGPYRELHKEEWVEIFKILKKYDAKLTVGVTACWVNQNCELIPFNKKHPEEFEILKQGVDENLIEIGNHGLTHCVLKNKKFLPHYFKGNRTYHREFWDWIPEEEQEMHIKESQKILEKCFGRKITLFIPPGNVFTDKTIKLVSKYGITKINCYTKDKVENDVQIISNNNVIDFHDKEIVELGTKWLEDKINMNSGKEICFVSDL
tara:strand:- start:60 stop:806 length:747 start_codon:yes stop_codon:yes gene_type:complete